MADLNMRLKRAFAQINAVVMDKEEGVFLTMACLLARGHVLLEDLPGAGKTTLAKTFASTVGLEFARVQFTADLLPSDVIGFSTLNNQALVFHKGAVFTQLLLADEINRASPKSQSALLEAMEERQVTVERVRYELPRPFFVIATQNPVEQVGTFHLPESQLDRFMMRLSLGYPSAKQEVAILQGNPREVRLPQLQAVLSPEDVLALQTLVAEVHVSQAVAQYVQRLLAYSRESGAFIHGLSTRAGLALVSAAKAVAFLQGTQAVLPEHVQRVFVAVAGHRLQARGQGDSQAMAQEMLKKVAV